MLYLIICLYPCRDLVAILVQNTRNFVFIHIAEGIKDLCNLEVNFWLLLGLKYSAAAYYENILGK